MEINIFSNSLYLGRVEAEIIDKSMGVIGGKFIPSAIYLNQFQTFFRRHTNTPDWKELETLALQASNAIGEIIQATGGFCITDIIDFNEIDIEICGVDYEVIDMISQYQ